MPKYTIETPRGRKLTIEAQTPGDATALADQWDLQDHAVSEAQRLGVRPDLILRQMHMESGTKADAVSPKGARGPMQLMPSTAKELGVNPDDPYQNITGGITYLKKQLDAFNGDEAKALAAYNAGPGAVRRAGGVPNFPETQKYVSALAGQVPQMGGSTPVRQTSVNPADVAAMATGPVQPTRAQEAWSGFKQPFQTLAADVAASQERSRAKLTGAPPNLLNALTDMAKIGGDVLGLLTAPAMAAVRPGSSAFVDTFGGPTVAGQLGFKNGRLIVGAPRTLKGGEAKAQIEANVNTALSAGRPANAKPIAPPRPVPKSLEELDQAQKAAWRAVDASTYQFPAADTQAAVTDIKRIVADADPDLYPTAAKWANSIERMAQRGQLTLGKLNTLKSRMGAALMNGPEAPVASDIMNRVETLIGTAQDPSLNAAREAYKRFMKVKTVTNRLQGAEVDQMAATGAGGNPNRPRQALKPLIKSTSPQRMKNATPDEVAALKKVVGGTPVQNILRPLSGLDPFGGKMQTMLGLLGQGVAFGKTGGMSLLAAPIGMAANAGQKAIEAKNVKELIDLMSTGGVKYRAPAQVSGILQPFAPVPGPIPQLAAAAAVQPALREAMALSEAQTGGTRAKTKTPQKPSRR